MLSIPIAGLFVSLWHQMVLPRARSLISHRHLGTARNWCCTHPSLIKCCNGMQSKLLSCRDVTQHWRPAARRTRRRGASTCLCPLYWPLQRFPLPSSSSCTPQLHPVFSTEWPWKDPFHQGNAPHDYFHYQFIIPLLFSLIIQSSFKLFNIRD